MTGTRVVHFPRRPRAGDTVRRAVDQALEAAPPVGLDAVAAEIARGTASLVDSAIRSQDARLFLASSDRLLRLTARLEGKTYDPDRPPGSRPGSAPALADELAAELGAGPTVGDEPES